MAQYGIGSFMQNQLKNSKPFEGRSSSQVGIGSFMQNQLKNSKPFEGRSSSQVGIGSFMQNQLRNSNSFDGRASAQSQSKTPGTVRTASGKKLTPKNSTPEERAAAQQKQSGNSKGGNARPEQGMFGLNNIMNSFYNYQPDSDDEYGNYMKNTFASNMISICV